jgi:cytochrome d ubiquinol oxidase subunit II
MVTLAQFWCAVIVLALLVYVVLDGFDLGVGMLIGMTSDTKHRARMLKTIDPVWDGNETWLVVVGATLYATFPTAYAILLPAFYAAFVCMLLALIFRGIGIEARNRSERARLRWDRAIIIGSAVAAFSQGVIVGNLTGGIAVENGQFVGVTLDSFTVFSVIAGVGCIVGYALHGLSWLVLKTDGELRAWAYARIPTFALGWCMILAILFWRMLQNHPEVLAKWSVISPLLFLPAIGLLACGGLAYGVHRRIDGRRNVCANSTALHRALVYHRRGSCSTASLIIISAVRRRVCAARYTHLYQHRLLGVPRQSARQLTP